jgi:hypothetical protein
MNLQDSRRDYLHSHDLCLFRKVGPQSLTISSIGHSYLALLYLSC